MHLNSIPILCIICASDISAHSFHRIQWLNPDVQLFYSRPAESTRYFDREGVLHHFDVELTNLHNSSWAWVIDFRDFSLDHAKEVRSIIDITHLVLYKYPGQLKKIWAIHVNSVVKHLFTIFRAILPSSIIDNVVISDKSLADIQAMRFFL